MGLSNQQAITKNVDSESFTGCKLALIFEDKLVVYLRDDKTNIPFPNQWDFPGGGREGKESAQECVLRELHEEFDIRLPIERLIYQQRGINQTANGHSYFFVAYITQTELDAINFGSEGQYWQLMTITDYLAHPAAIAPLKQRLQQFLATN
ncbi:NUDIX hydrolase [Shewanella sp. 5_MG-2023]|uniref:NUDIX hydrolase n=1 Tax=Shewanella sp. 5_MG-2023 TaxID=3062656 RepID=UPI0026E172D2|nr:NUDIX hydrolase [Shewanella sp. 5_MG-2023]MDO6641846.1 NUDIX hydrolase [Shewanella sp. 5_MG-2023]